MSLMIRFTLMAAVALGACATSLAAAVPTWMSTAVLQETGVVTGRVVQASTGRPIGAAQVSVVDASLGTTTGNDGRFRIIGVPEGRVTIQVQMIGFGVTEKEVTVTSGDVVAVNFQLSEEAISLDEIVVTGTAGRQERRAQGATIGNVDVAEVMDLAPVQNVTEVLQGRIPGVSVSQGSGVAGTGQQIRVRGASSISLSNEPLIYVDGVRIDTELSGVASGATVSALNFVNPADIESIEVVKGPAAATLYGADATAGVIQIITKSGRAAQGFQHTMAVSAGYVDPHYFNAERNFGTCRAEDVANTSSLCSGLQVGAVVSDDPFERYGLPNNGTAQSYSWTTRGGGDGWGLFASVGHDREAGIFPNSEYERTSARVNYNLIPTDKVRIEFSVPVTMAGGDYPVTGGSSRGWTIGGMAGTPLTVGTPTDGWFASNRTPEAIAAIEHTLEQVRVIPDLKLSWNPSSRFTNRLTVGGDVNLTEVSSFYPKNNQGWYSSSQNRGDITEERTRLLRLTVNYLGTMDLPLTDSWGSMLSVGTEIQAENEDFTFATGNGLTTNAARSVNAASQVSGGQLVIEDRRVGIYGQWEPNFRERLYFQFGARADRFAAFGSEASWFLSPSARVSYVVSDEPFFQMDWVDQLRLRAAYGTTGRAPTAGAALRTYSAAPYLLGPSRVGAGVIPLNAGNPELEAERGQEFEAGFDLGLLENRLGVELTYFHQTTSNLLLRVPQPPSLGFIEDPFRNIGKVLNTGFEFAVTGQLLSRDNVGWEVQAGVNTLRNEVIDLGGVSPFSTIRFDQVNRVVEGYQVGGYWSNRVLDVDTENGVAIVSDELEYMGNLYPTLEGHVGSTVTLFGDVRLYANVDFKQDVMQYNATAVYRERNFNMAENWVRQDEVLSAEERLRRFGPYVTQSGTPVGPSSVLEEYIEPADLVRLNEVSLRYQLPAMLIDRLPTQGGAITLSARNVAVWHDYSGFYPDVQNEFDAVAGRADFYTLPPSRRFTARIDLDF